MLRMNNTCTPKSVYEHIPTGKRICTLTEKMTDRPMPMKTEQACDGSHHVAAADYSWRGSKAQQLTQQCIYYSLLPVAF